MKIAFLSFYSGHYDRGVEVATSALAYRLSKEHTVRVFQSGSKIAANVPTVIINNEKWPVDTSTTFLRRFYLDTYSLKILFFTIKTLTHLWHEHFDVIIPTNGGWQILIIRLVASLQKSKLIIQGNAGIGRDERWQLMLAPDAYIAISPKGYQWASANRYRTKKITYIPFGVDLKEISKAQKLPLPLTAPVILCVAAFSPYKRIELTIAAVAKIPSVSLLIIGQGPLQSQLQRQGEEALKERFLLRTNISHTELLRYYKSCSVFTLPSAQTEALGIVYLEALAAGMQVVAPNDENRRMLLKDAALYTDVTDAHSYSKTLQEALSKKFTQKQKAFISEFDWDNIAKQYNLLLKSL